MSLEDRFRQSLTAAVDEVRTKLEAEFLATLTDVRSEAEAERATALSDARASVEADLLRAFTAEKDALVFSHQGALAQIKEAASAEAARLREEAATATARTREESEHALATLRAEMAEAVSQARAQSQEASAAALADALRRHEELEATTLAARDDHARALQAAHAELQTAASAHADAVSAHASSASRMLEGIRALDDAGSLTEVLDALGDAVAKEAGRSATMVVKGDRLIGWRASGLGAADASPRSLEASVLDTCVLAAAVNTARPAVAGHGSVLHAPAFAQLPPEQVGVAVPLIVGGRAVAVVYADAGSAEPTPSWQAAVEALIRHAGRCLEAMTVQRAVTAKSAPARVTTPA